MTIHTWPTLTRRAPLQLDWSLLSNTQSFTSPLSKAVQTVEMPGARWAFSFGLNTLAVEDAAVLRAFLVRLRGQSGRFYMWDMSRPAPRGVATGTPLVKGGSQAGTSLLTDGWTPSTAGILKAGDYLGVNGELKLLVADANSNAGGEATLVFEPPLRAAPADNAPITTTKPTAIFKLDEDTARWLTTAPVRDSFVITATETW